MPSSGRRASPTGPAAGCPAGGGPACRSARGGGYRRGLGIYDPAGGPSGILWNRAGRGQGGFLGSAGPLTSARLGPILLFALAAGAMYYRLAGDYSHAAAAGAVAAMLLQPRLFAHLHFASFDGPLTSCWILAWATFAAARGRSAWAVLWGVTLGMTLGCKITGWIAAALSGLDRLVPRPAGRPGPGHRRRRN